MEISLNKILEKCDGQGHMVKKKLFSKLLLFEWPQHFFNLCEPDCLSIAEPSDERKQKFGMGISVDKILEKIHDQGLSVKDGTFKVIALIWVTPTFWSPPNLVCHGVMSRCYSVALQLDVTDYKRDHTEVFSFSYEFINSDCRQLKGEIWFHTSLCSSQDTSWYSTTPFSIPAIDCAFTNKLIASRIITSKTHLKYHYDIGIYCRVPGKWGLQQNSQAWQTLHTNPLARTVDIWKY